MANLLNNIPLVNGISLIIAIVIPLVVMSCTLHSQSKQYKAEMKARDSQFVNYLKQSAKNHNESLQAKANSDRIAQLPFLSLGQVVHEGKRNGHKTFSFEIENLGNGVALDISVETEAGNQGWPIVYKNSLASHSKEYLYTDVLSSNVLPIYSKAKFEILLMCFDNGNEESQEGVVFSERVYFSIKYKDAFLNDYKQQYKFEYGTGSGVGIIESGLPELII